MPRRVPHRRHTRHTRNLSVPAFAVPAVALLALTLAAPVALGQELSARIVSLIRGAEIGPNAVVGVSVVDCRTGTVIAAYQDTESLQPASNQKLLTTGAALAILGPDFVFKTRLVQSGANLVIIGDGDPALGDPEILSRMSPPLSPEDLLSALTNAVTRASISRVREIIADDRVFDREFIHPGWPTDQLDKHYAAGVAGLNFHANVLAFYPAPGASGPGSRATCQVEPNAPWIPINIDAITVGRDGRHQYGVIRDMAQNRFTVYGQIRSATQVAARVALHEPNLFLANLLTFRLSRAGLTLGDNATAAQLLQRVRLAQASDTFPEDRTLALVTTSLTDVARRCNVDSVNLYAEALLKRMGHHLTSDPGSFTNGAAAMRMEIASRLGHEAAATTIISDGSGFSRGNRVQPAVLTSWLRSIANDPEIGDEFLASLPAVGEGTLDHRFQRVSTNNLILAKSGTIVGVRCLSGYVIHQPSGRRIAFSVMVNGLREGTDGPRNALRLHEQIVAEIDQWLTRRVEAASANVGG